MFAKIQYTTTTWTSANVFADMIKILTGETNLANLSANVDAGNSYINTSSRVAGWASHDVVNSTTTVIKAPVADNGSQYKYVKLTLVTNNISAILYEDWNATTHVGTNPTAATTTLHASSPGSSLTVEISASVRHFAVATRATANSVLSTGPHGVFEHTRRTYYDTVSNGYLPAVASNCSVSPTLGFLNSLNLTGVSSTYAEFAACRLPYLTASVPVINVTGTSCPMAIVLPNGTPHVATSGASFSSLQGLSNQAGSGVQGVLPPSAMVWSVDKTEKVHAFVGIGCQNPVYGWLGGDISDYADIWLTTSAFGLGTDIAAWNGNNYMVWADSSQSSNIRWAVRIG